MGIRVNIGACHVTLQEIANKEYLLGYWGLKHCTDMRIRLWHTRDELMSKRGVVLTVIINHYVFRLLFVANPKPLHTQIGIIDKVGLLLVLRTPFLVGPSK